MVFCLPFSALQTVVNASPSHAKVIVVVHLQEVKNNQSRWMDTKHIDGNYSSRFVIVVVEPDMVISCTKIVR